MAVNAAEGERVARACLVNGVADRAVGRIDAGVRAIASGRIVAGAATIGGMPGLDAIPRLDLSGVATVAAAPLARRKIPDRVVL